MAATPKLSLLFCIFSIWAVDFAYSASHHAPAPSVDCSNLVLNMAECLSFVSNGSTASKPEGECCKGLKTVLGIDPECLCEAFKSSAQLGVVLNVTKALALPAACKIRAPPSADCGLSLTAAAPALSPESSPTSVAGAPGMNDGTNEQAPAPAPGSSGSSVLSIAVGSLVVGLIVASISGF